jgi:hypothetical protein
MAYENRPQVLVAIIVRKIRDAMPDAGDNKPPVDVDTVVEAEGKAHIRPKGKNSVSVLRV